tara:strand:+ start:39 stop:1178 length:1140 start_codon:yes stop_codon:yes gene_type:complete
MILNKNIDYLFVCGSRGEWGYIRPIIDECVKRKIKYSICLCNMVVIDKYGSLNKEIKKKYNVIDEFDMSIEGHTHFTMIKSLNVFGINFVELIKRAKPKWVILAGDRGEQLIASICCSFTYTPCAHIQAGELSGNIDNTSRLALARFCHVHFAANNDAYFRLLKSGEEKRRIFKVGAPQLDEIKNKVFLSKNQIKIKYPNVNIKNYILVVFHPITEEYKNLTNYINNLCKALDKFDMQKIWILPNNDAGSNVIRENILDKRDTNAIYFRNLSRFDYLGLLNNCKILIGNSSSGIIESPSLNKFSVNIGKRQKNRIQSRLTLNCSYDESDIRKTIEKALNKKNVKKIVNPYGKGNSSKKILDVLKNIYLGDHFLVKNITF